MTDIDSRREFFQRIRTIEGLRLWRGPSFPFSREAVEKAMSSAFQEDLEQLKSGHGIDLSNWSIPKAIDLTESSECAIIRDIAKEHLPSGPELDANLDVILAVFLEQGMKLPECNNPDPERKEAKIMRIREGQSISS